MSKLRILLYPFSLVYNLITTIRNLFFRFKIFGSHQSGTPIISIGNLSTGGTGKSPHTELLIKLLDGKKIAVLSRGYKRKTAGYILANSESTVNDIGDEPFVFHKKYPQVQVAVDEKRKRGIQNLIKDIQPDVILLDDAYQHRSVSPDFQIMLTDYYHPFYDDFVLPAGNLRENRFGARRAQVIVVSKAPENLKPNQKKDILDNVASYSSAKILFSHIRYGQLTSVFNQLTTSPDFEHVIALTGIAKSDIFVRKVREIAPKVQHHKFQDHYSFTEEDIIQIVKYFHKISSEKKAIITTEKDAIRLLEFQHLLADIPLYYWPIEIFMSPKEEEFLKDSLMKIL
jgi:tetraacyldisaccharide 4'-kinase